MRILLTNDDGPHSPLLAFAIEALGEIAEIDVLKIAIPDGEQSWKSHAMSGHGAINPRQTTIADTEVVLVDGTPADCVDWAMHNLFADDQWPDLVVAGVNCGKNSGLGFVLSSATIGACLHANVAEPPRPGLALSQDFHDLSRAAAVKNGRADVAELAVLRDRIKKQLRAVWDFLQRQADFPQQPLTWNVNLPAEPSPECRIRQSTIGDSRLAQCFQERQGRFEHALARYIEDPHPGCDGSVLDQGHISISRLDIRRLCG
ncbi:MAG: hypothetical protein C0613_06645 [Desulfobulbaceae bacterium]|nr:MAG: hypothetical protein C0613_06645 [Desulfobulbaceae bacterium]